MLEAVIPRQPQGQSGLCLGRTHGNDWVSTARFRRRARHSDSQDLHFEESHGQVGQILEVGWPEIQAGWLVRHFHDW